jgi:hypothetical protein
MVNGSCDNSDFVLTVDCRPRPHVAVLAFFQGFHNFGQRLAHRVIIECDNRQDTRDPAYDSHNQHQRHHSPLSRQRIVDEYAGKQHPDDLIVNYERRIMRAVVVSEQRGSQRVMISLAHDGVYDRIACPCADNPVASFINKSRTQSCVSVENGYLAAGIIFNFVHIFLICQVVAADDRSDYVSAVVPYSCAPARTQPGGGGPPFKQADTSSGAKRG